MVNFTEEAVTYFRQVFHFIPPENTRKPVRNIFYLQAAVFEISK